MDDIREKLMRRAYLYADAEAYRAGVDAALAALTTTDEAQSVDVDEHAALLSLNG